MVRLPVLSVAGECLRQESQMGLSGSLCRAAGLAVNLIPCAGVQGRVVSGFSAMSDAVHTGCHSASQVGTFIFLLLGLTTSAADRYRTRVFGSDALVQPGEHTVGDFILSEILGNFQTDP